MNDERGLRRKWTWQAGGRRIVLVKQSQERAEHVLVKGLLWALHLPHYPTATIEPPSQGRYKPDVADFALDGTVRFWAESGHVAPDKLAYLLRKFPDVHFALGKWDASPAAVRELVERACRDVRRHAPIDCWIFPPDGLARFVGPRGELTISPSDLVGFRRLGDAWTEAAVAP